MAVWIYNFCMKELMKKVSQLAGVISSKIKRIEEKSQGVYVRDPELEDTEKVQVSGDIVEIRFVRDKNYLSCKGADYVTDVLQTVWTGYCDYMKEERLGFLSFNDKRDGFDVWVDHYHTCIKRTPDKSSVFGVSATCKITNTVPRNYFEPERGDDVNTMCTHGDSGKIDFDQIKNPVLRKKLLDKYIASEFSKSEAKMLAKELLIKLQIDEEEKLSAEILEHCSKVKNLKLKLAEKKKQRREAEIDLRREEGRGQKLSKEVIRHKEKIKSLN